MQRGFGSGGDGEGGTKMEGEVTGEWGDGGVGNGQWAVFESADDLLRQGTNSQKYSIQ